jgi:hypothetical protein
MMSSPTRYFLLVHGNIASAARRESMPGGPPAGIISLFGVKPQANG